MIKFTLKTFGFVIVLFLGILIGMQQVTDNMDQMRGTNSSSAFELNSTEKNLEAEVLGQQITSHDIEEKQKKLEDIHSFNFFSEIGSKISAIISGIFTVLLSIFEAIIGKLTG